MPNLKVDIKVSPEFLAGLRLAQRHIDRASQEMIQRFCENEERLILGNKPKGEVGMSPKNTARKRFYVASSAINSNPNSDYLKHDMKAAIETAKEQLEKDPAAKERYVVKIVAIVKRMPTPVKVEKLRG